MSLNMRVFVPWEENPVNRQTPYELYTLLSSCSTTLLNLPDTSLPSSLSLHFHINICFSTHERKQPFQDLPCEFCLNSGQLLRVLVLDAIKESFFSFFFFPQSHVCVSSSVDSYHTAQHLLPTDLRLCLQIVLLRSPQPTGYFYLST